MTLIKKAFGKVNIHFPFEKGGFILKISPNSPFFKEGELNSYDLSTIISVKLKKLEHRINAFWQA